MPVLEFAEDARGDEEGKRETVAEKGVMRMEQPRAPTPRELRDPERLEYAG